MTQHVVYDVGVASCLDVCCAAGGATRGYMDAGFVVVGVDITPQPNFPGGQFLEMDGLELDPEFIRTFDLVHVSPPCQGYSTAGNRWPALGHPRLIAAFRALLQTAGVPYVIENVPGAKRELHNPICLSGGSFGLQVERPRLFETSFPCAEPKYVKVADSIAVYGDKASGRNVGLYGQRIAQTLQEARDAMGIDWMNWDEIVEAIPPAYTRWIADQYLNPVESDRHCLYCRAPIITGRSDRKFCNDAHKLRHFQQRHLL